MDNKKLVFIIAYAILLLSIISSTAADSSSSTNGSTGTNSHKSPSSTATQARQSPMSAAASMVGALSSLVPSLITNVAPLILLFGIGTMMMPSLGMSAMNLLRESRRSGHEALNMPLANNPFAQYSTRPIQTSPQDIYYFTKRSLPSLMSSFNSEPLRAGLLDLLERVVRAIDNADKRYN